MACAGAMFENRILDRNLGFSPVETSSDVLRNVMNEPDTGCQVCLVKTMLALSYNLIRIPHEPKTFQGSVLLQWVDLAHQD